MTTISALSKQNLNINAVSAKQLSAQLPAKVAPLTLQPRKDEVSISPEAQAAYQKSQFSQGQPDGLQAALSNLEAQAGYQKPQFSLPEISTEVDKGRDVNTSFREDTTMPQASPLAQAARELTAKANEMQTAAQTLHMSR